MKKKPSQALAVTLILASVLWMVGATWHMVATYGSSRLQSLKALALVIVPALLMILIGSLLALKVHRKEAVWFWENQRDQITQARLRKVDGRKPAPYDFKKPRKDMVYTFCLTYGRHGTYSVSLTMDDPGFDEVYEKAARWKSMFRPGIVRTKIAGVNHETVTTTSGLSLSRAVLGGMVAGEFGAAVGALSGKRTRRTTVGDTLITFLVYYENGSLKTETVKANSKRFQELAVYLEN